MKRFVSILAVSVLASSSSLFADDPHHSYGSHHDAGRNISPHFYPVQVHGGGHAPVHVNPPHVSPPHYGGSHTPDHRVPAPAQHGDGHRGGGVYIPVPGSHGGFTSHTGHH